MNQQITKIRRKLIAELDKERYEHTLGVMYTAASMAMCHGADVEQALLAGLLHVVQSVFRERIRLKCVRSII